MAFTLKNVSVMAHVDAAYWPVINRSMDRVTTTDTWANDEYNVHPLDGAVTVL